MKTNIIKFSSLSLILVVMIIMACGNCFAEFKVLGYWKKINTAEEIKTPDGIICLTVKFTPVTRTTYGRRVMMGLLAGSNETNAIKGHFTFKNDSTKTLNAVVYKVLFFDIFGEKIHEETGTDTRPLKSGKKQSEPHKIIIYDNLSDANDSYDKINSLISSKALKIEVKIVKVLYGDDTVKEYGGGVTS
jgi:hypothetical protein